MTTQTREQELEREIEEPSYIGHEEIWSSTRDIKDVPTINCMMSKAELKGIQQGKAEAHKEEIEFLHHIGSCLSHTTIDRLITERLNKLQGDKK